jgi:hypothetical protein
VGGGQHPWQKKPQGFVPELERITKQVHIWDKAFNLRGASTLLL